jgi:hypothetical protein
MSSDNSYSKA